MASLYTYWRSSAAFRVRIAIALKGLTVEQIPVHLIKDGGQQHSEQYQQQNPAELVPCYVDEALSLNQSLAIIEYLDARYPNSRLIPADAMQAALVRALALDIACDVHPLNNLRVLQYLTQTLGVDETQKLAWIHHWLALGFKAIEQRLLKTAGRCCFGDTVSLADLCLVPQVYNAIRFQFDLTPYPTIARVYHDLMTRAEFKLAAPEQQADAQ